MTQRVAYPNPKEICIRPTTFFNARADEVIDHGTPQPLHVQLYSFCLQSLRGVYYRKQLYKPTSL